MSPGLEAGSSVASYCLPNLLLLAKLNETGHFPVRIMCMGTLLWINVETLEEAPTLFFSKYEINAPSMGTRPQDYRCTNLYELTHVNYIGC